MEDQEHEKQQNHDDHDRDHDQDRGSSGVGGSRWNPTKEQIALLEKMYSEGVRTPSAEQIQQITVRLKAYGHIEGKNVFYWFQNHKARQRQKQRQQRLHLAATLHNSHHLLTHHSFLSPQHYHPNHHHNHNLNLNLSPKPIFPARPSTNYHLNNHHYLPNPNASAICNPYWYQLPQSNLQGFYPLHPTHHHISAPPPSSNHRPVDQTRVPLVPSSTSLISANGYCAPAMINMNHNSTYDDHGHQVQDQTMGVRTLDLFPVHPTGILEHKVVSATSTNSSSSPTNSSVDTNTSDTIIHQQHQRLFEFFSSESD